MRKEKILYSVLILSVILLGSQFKNIYAHLLSGKEEFQTLPLYTRMCFIQVPILLICLLTAYVICGFSGTRFLKAMGMDKNPLPAFGLALICCSPMLIGYYYVSGGHLSSDVPGFFWKALWPGVNEELVYRAFLFGLLVRLCGWNIFVAMLLQGLLFASGHLYQAASFGESIGILVFTTLVAAGFSLFYITWDWSIWFVIGMHVLMDFAWQFYSIDANVLGSLDTNILRFASIGLAVFFTVWKSIRNRKTIRQQIREGIMA